MAASMDAADLLGQLHRHGQDAGSVYNDDGEFDGWFSWTVAGGVLAVTFQGDDLDDDGHNAVTPVTCRWRLVPIEAS